VLQHHRAAGLLVQGGPPQPVGAVPYFAARAARNVAGALRDHYHDTPSRLPALVVGPVPTDDLRFFDFLRFDRAVSGGISPLCPSVADALDGRAPRALAGLSCA